MPNKIVLITGCSSGFGYLTALKLGKEGYQTLATVRDIESESAQKLQKIITQEKLPIKIYKLDISQDESVDRLFEQLKSEDKQIDILINNAGFGYMGPVEETRIEDLRIQYETNVYGTLRMMKKVLPSMREKKDGLIINLSSIVGLIPFPLYGAYSSSKFALESLSETLAFEVSKFGIKIVLVEPGAFATEFSNSRRLIKQHTPSSPYKNLVDMFTNSSRTNLKQDPQKVADLIYNIATTSNPALRYRIGKDSLYGAIVKRIIPQRLWTLLLRKVYKW